MSFNAVVRWRHNRPGFHPRPMLRPLVGSGVIISWAGMRGVLTLAAAMALPHAFPYRDLIVLTAFAVVVGTLVIQGLTLKPLLRALNLKDGDPVGQEVSAARERALRAGLATFDDDKSPLADAMREAFTIRLAPEDGEDARSIGTQITVAALHAAGGALLAMRSNDEIGDDGLRRFMATTASMRPLSGPFGPGRGGVWAKTKCGTFVCSEAVKM